MINIVISLLLLIEGNRATSPYRCPEDDCGVIPFPNEIPQNNDDLQKMCTPLIEPLKCKVNVTEGCEPYNEKAVQIVKRLLSTITDICSEDTLLHADVVHSLECFSTFSKDGAQYCPIEKGSIANERVQIFAAALKEEGLLSLADNENDTRKLHRCIEGMFSFVCLAEHIEKKCGTVAMDTYVEVIHSFGPGQFAIECEETFDQLPAVIRLRNMVRNNAKGIVDVPCIWKTSIFMQMIFVYFIVKNCEFICD